MRRLLDITVSSVGLAILALPMAAVALCVRANMGAPAIFRQQRYGLNQVPFTIYKFRSMTDQCDDAGNPLPDTVRMTRLGRFLRRTSLDELPQLVNILKGDMSLIGPRPTCMLYPEKFSERYNVLPGLTGLAQVTARRDRLSGGQLDVEYVRNRSLLLDLKILTETFNAVASGRGTGAAPITPVPGNKKPDDRSPGL